MGVFSFQSKPIITAVGLSLGIATAVWAYKKFFNKNSIPTNWVKIGVVTDLFCYPVKSCAPVKVQEINCENIGFRNGLLRDRVFIVVNSETGRLITGHRYPELVLINPKVEDKALILAGSGMSELKVDIDKAMKYVSWKKVEVSGTALDVIDCGEEAAEWLSQFIFKNNHGLRLFYYPSSRPMKPVDPKDRKRWPSTTSPKHTGATHDMTSYMIMNLASVEELNKRLDEPVSPLQFRPNIVFTGLPAFDEDQIRWFKIGEHAVFKFVQPCLRCSFTTVSPETGQKHPSAEPLQTLKSFRTVAEYGKSPVLGVHLGVIASSSIKVGDIVYKSK